MKTYSNTKLKKILQQKGINLDKRKKHLFNQYNYYQVINTYKNIFYERIETIDDIEQNILKNIDISRYQNIFNIKNYQNNSQLFKMIEIKICQKYGITYKNTDNETLLKEKIRSIDYYNHIYSKNVFYSDFVRIYKFEHELRNILLKYTLIIEESLKNIVITYLNNIEAKDNFLTDINQYETNQKNINNTINSIKKILDKQTNKYSNPIKRKNFQELTIPYWISVNELTLGETIRLIINLKEEHKNKILENCVNYFTNMNLKYEDLTTKDEKENYYNYINVMREMLNIIGIFRNNLAHNQPIYNFNVKEFCSSKYNKVNYSLPNAKTTKDQYALNTKYMSYFANFFGTDKYNSFAGNTNINLSWIIYVIYKFIIHLDKNTNFYTELTYVYQKYNIILKPRKVAINKYNLYEEMLNKLDEYSELDFGLLKIITRYDNNLPIKQNLISLNKKINDMKKEMKKLTKQNLNNNDCLKYTHFLFDKDYTKYTGIDKKYFDKLV